MTDIVRVRSKVCWMPNLGAWAQFTTADDLETGVRSSSWSLWRSWRGAMNAAAATQTSEIQVIWKLAGRREAVREFDRTYSARRAA